MTSSSSSFLYAELLDVQLWQWLVLIVFSIAFWLGATLLEHGLTKVAARAAKVTQHGWDDQLALAASGPGRLFLFSAFITASSPLLALKPGPAHVIRTVATSVVIIATAWFVHRFVRLLCELIAERVAEERPETTHHVRGVRTQLAVLRRVANAALYVITLSLLLLQLEGVRNIGVSLLASAGVAGLVLGLAAQKSISTLLAGVQLSLTQPVRIGDTVIVENEWGWVEDITLTYAVIRVWDLRRLVVPITWFLDRPFQNWSKVSSDILGTVELAADPRTDVAALRQELERVLREEAGALWDGKVAGAQVTASNELSMTVRLLVSSRDPSANWDLRCLVRERLLTWLQAQPHGLPVFRTEQVGPNPASAGGAPAVRNNLNTRPLGRVL